MWKVVVVGALLLSIAAAAPEARAQAWGRVAGRVLDAEDRSPLAGVTVVVSGTNFGTATGSDGRYALRVPAGRYALRFTFVGFLPLEDSVAVYRETTTEHNVALAPATLELEGLTVESAVTRRDAGVVEIDPEYVQRIPAPFKDGFRIVKLQPGVATNNEISNEYSVRGGGFNENLFFLDGFEIYKPFRVRQGEQEGLGLVNPDLASRMTLYAGGFPARYGGKLSSALDVHYVRPNQAPRSASVYASLLDAGATAMGSAAGGRIGLAGAFRKAQARRFFEAQELQGSYDPDYTDLQGIATFRPADGHEVEAIAIWARHRFRLEPTTRKTFFGTYDNLQSLWVNYSGQENDGYETTFVGLRVGSRLSRSLQLEHRYAYFETDEHEDFGIRGSAILYVIENPFESDPDTGEGLIPVGASTQQDLADNRIQMRSHTVSGQLRLTGRHHAAEAGWSIRGLLFEDRIAEKSVLQGRAATGLPVRVVVDSLTDQARFTAGQFAVYVQDAVDVLPERDRLTLTAGLRLDSYTFNDEQTLSPRLSARYRVDSRTSLTGAWGVFYQAPSYRELRGVPEPGSGILGALNRDLRSQRSVQTLAGIEHFVRSRRMTVRAEAYYKVLSRLISYDVQNVRVAYAGENDSRGAIAGFDVQLRGELVPGLESWLNYGFLVARERFSEPFLTPYNRGMIARPTDQRHTISIFVQDYIPRDPSWKIGLRMLFGSGLPYTPPVPGPRVGNVEIQLPGPRSSARYPSYKRVDLGATKIIPLASGRNGDKGPTLSLSGEVLNVFDMVNVVAYTWVVGANGIWSRIPTRLTNRTVNLRVRLEL